MPIGISKRDDQALASLARINQMSHEKAKQVINILDFDDLAVYIAARNILNNDLTGDENELAVKCFNKWLKFFKRSDV